MIRNRDLTVGVFLIAGVLMFTVGIFLIGGQRKTFSRNFEVYTEFADVSGLMKGAKVQVAGSGAGEVTDILVPDSPDARFRLRLRIDERFHSMVRADSVAVIATEGVIGDKFIQISAGSAQSVEAAPGSTLSSKTAVDMAQMMEKGARLLDETSSTIKTTGEKLNGTLDAATAAVSSANDVIAGLKEGKGTAGMLLRDEETAARIRQTVASIQDTANSLNHTVTQADALISDLNARQFGAKADELLTSAQVATENVRAATGQIRQAVNATLGPNGQGVDTATNLREIVANLDQATENMVEDTEAAKHNVLLRGYFKHQGYFDLAHLSAEDYRKNKRFSTAGNRREWLSQTELFEADGGHVETLSPTGRARIDGVVASWAGSLGASPLIVEGYATTGNTTEQMSLARSRAVLVREYIRSRFRLDGQMIAVEPLGSQPPTGLGRDQWDGVSVLLLASSRH
jgi:phospholipid/cholesterol/gamma-HCH transport system substrate-binding protein